MSRQFQGKFQKSGEKIRSENRGLNTQNRAAGLLHHTFGGTADQKMGQACAAMSADHDEFDVFLIGIAADFLEGDTGDRINLNMQIRIIGAQAFGLAFKLATGLTKLLLLFFPQTARHLGKVFKLAVQMNIKEIIAGIEIVAQPCRKIKSFQTVPGEIDGNENSQWLFHHPAP